VNKQNELMNRQDGGAVGHNEQMTINRFSIMAHGSNKMEIKKKRDTHMVWMKLY
jgi:hypothetical protein